MRSILCISTLCALCSLSSCVSTRIGPRVGTDFPTGSGGFNTVAGVTAEGWYSKTGFLRFDPQVKTLHSSKSIPPGYVGSTYNPFPVAVEIQSSATFLELPVMFGFTLKDSTAIRPIFGLGLTAFKRITSTTTTPEYYAPNDGHGSLVYSTFTESAPSDWHLAFCASAGAMYAVSAFCDLRMELRAMLQPSTVPYWDPMHDYVSGSTYTQFTTPSFSASLMCSAIFRL